MPTNDIIEFILYVVPGFIVIELYRLYYPVKEKDIFNKIAWSIIIGILINSFANWLDKTFFFLTLSKNNGDLPNLAFIILLCILGMLVGIVWVIFRTIRFRLANESKTFNFFVPAPQSIWAYINESHNEDWSVVHLNDGTIYLGWITLFSFNPEYENQDFLLSHAKLVDKDLNEIYSVDGLGVYLNTRDVVKIEFIHGEN